MFLNSIVAIFIFKQWLNILERSKLIIFQHNGLIKGGINLLGVFLEVINRPALYLF